MVEHEFDMMTHLSSQHSINLILDMCNISFLLRLANRRSLWHVLNLLYYWDMHAYETLLTSSDCVVLYASLSSVLVTLS